MSSSWMDDAEEVKSSWMDDAEEIGNDTNPTMINSAARGLSQGLTLGWFDEMVGAGKASADYLGQVFYGNEGETNTNDWTSSYEKHRDDERRKNREASETNPWSYGISEFAGTVIPSVATGPGASALSRAALAATSGGISGLGTSNADSVQGLADDAAFGAALGGGLSLGGDAVISGIKKGYNSILKPTTAKIGQLLTGVDDQAILRQVERPYQSIAAEGDDFVQKLSLIAQEEVDNLQRGLGENVNKANRRFTHDFGDDLATNESTLASAKIGDFLHQNTPSKKGWSSLSEKETSFLEDLSEKLFQPDTTMDDLYKLRGQLDNQQKLAGKFDKEGTGPYIRFLKELRHDLDGVVDKVSPQLNKVNTDYSNFLDDKKMFNPGNDNTVEGIVSNLFGANRKNKQDAAARLLSENTLESMKDISANKAFQKQGPAGSEMGLRNMVRTAVGVPTGGVLMIPMSPSVWKAGARALGKLEQSLMNPKYNGMGRFNSVLKESTKRGTLPVTHFLLSQQNAEYRDAMKKEFGEDDGE